MNEIIKEDIEDICNEKLPWDSLENKRILITGATGLIGTYLVYSLLEADKKYALNLNIDVLCRNKEKANEKFLLYIDSGRLGLIEADLLEGLEHIKNYEVIIHAASPTNWKDFNDAPYSIFESNVLALDSILKKMSLWSGGKLLLFSSSAVYGSNMDYPVAEEYRDSIDFANPLSVYGLSKQMCENMAEIYRKKEGLKIEIVRPFTVFGPGDKKKNSKAITDFIGDYLRGDEILIDSDGGAVRSYIYIKDAIKGIFYVLLKGKNETVNICSEKNELSILQLANIIAKEMGKELPVIVKGKKEHGRFNILIGTNYRLRSLGWKDETSIYDGIKRTIEWAKSVNYWE